MRFLFFLQLLVLHSLIGQDFHFSQYYASPMTLNPALTGQFNGTYRLTGIYRMQWDGVNTNQFLYQTPSASIDFNLLKNKLGIGIVMLNDQTNDKTFNTLEAGASFSYKLLLDKFQISFGLQGWYNQMYFDRNKILSGALQLEPNTNSSLSKFDFNAGIFTNYTITEEQTLFMGISSFHLLAPKDNLVSTSTLTTLPMKYALHIGADLKSSPKWGLLPGILYSNQAGASKLNIGNTFAYTLNPSAEEKKVTLLAGAWIRLNESTPQSIIPKLGLEYKNIRFAAAYDYTINSLGNDAFKAGVSTPNTFEISLSYIGKIKNEKNNEDNFIFNPRF